MSDTIDPLDVARAKIARFEKTWPYGPDDARAHWDLAHAQALALLDIAESLRTIAEQGNRI